MKKTFPAHILLRALALVVFCAALTSCNKKEAVKPEVARPVKLLTLGKDNTDIYRSFPGQVQAIQRAYLAFQVPGQIIELPIYIGQQVSKGELLARLDDKKYKSELETAKARLAKAKADYERYKKLYDKQAVSQSQYELMRKNYDVAKSDLEIAQKNQNDTCLKAPFAGIVASKNVKNYQNVKAEEKIILLKDLSQLEINIDVPARLITPGNARKTDKYAVIDNFPDKKFPLEIREFSTDVDPDTMTYNASLKILDVNTKSIEILPGMTANVFIRPKKTSEELNNPTSFAIPVQAVFAGSGTEKYVWVIDSKTMRAQKRQVKTGELTGNDIIITEGLKQGEIIAISGANYLHENQLVRQYQPAK